jgi:hypothetical protein
MAFFIDHEKPSFSSEIRENISPGVAGIFLATSF